MLAYIYIYRLRTFLLFFLFKIPQCESQMRIIFIYLDSWCALSLKTKSNHKSIFNMGRPLLLFLRKLNLSELRRLGFVLFYFYFPDSSQLFPVIYDSIYPPDPESIIEY
ncbi:hypothetical protein I3760_03G178000 [Carya illinoinensis]|nr:hypothetical protein I3760_03G178000 [Carya illinoinensis]